MVEEKILAAQRGGHPGDIVLTRPVDGSNLDSRCLITSWTEGNSFLAC